MRRSATICLGWALCLLSITVLTWGGSSVAESEAAGQSAFAFSLARLVAFSAGFFFGAWFAWGRRGPRLFARSAACAAGLLSLGGLAALASAFLPFWAVTAGAASIGAGSALLFMLWQSVLARQGSYAAGYLLAIASALGVLLFLPASSAQFFGRPVVVSVCAGLASVAVLCLAGRGEPAKARPARPNPKVKELLRDIWKPVLCVSAFGFVWQIVYALGLDDPTFSSVLQSSFVLSQVLASLALGVAWFKFHDYVHIELVFQLLFPLMATGFLCMPFFGHDYRVAFISLSLFAFGVMSILMQVACLQKSESLRIEPMAVVGVFAGFVYSSMTAGFAVGHALPSGGDFGFAHLLVLALVLVYGLSFVFFAVRFRWREPPAEPGRTASGELAEDAAGPCLAVAREAGLSVRETEVFELIVRGRDLPYIAEKLVVSKNTVRTHMKNVYAKLGVHSKQEAIDLVDARGSGP